MLTALTIQNIVLIDRLAMTFGAGFSALTGETGAGKSILLDSLGLALGTRAETRLVRKGADQAQVTAVFDMLPSDHPAMALLREAMIPEDTTLILRRSLSPDGRSRAFINDQPVSAGLLRSLGETLVEIHGQFETQGLLDAGTHRGILDDYAGIDRPALRRLWDEWKDAEARLATEREAMDQARRDENYLRQSCEDLDALAPETGEEERLATLRDRLMRREQILAALHTGYEGLNEAENIVGTAGRALIRAGEDGAGILAALDRAGAELQEALAGIQSLSADLSECEESLETIDDRLFALRAQARKHDCAVEDLPAMREELAARLACIDQQDGRLAALETEAARLKAAYVTRCVQISTARQKAAARLDALVAEELPPLKLEKARFETSVEPLAEAEWGPAGADQVRFLVATNPGIAPGPLSKIASGGEMARFMLALKVVMAETGAARTLIFDEVDTGIGGATAAAVGDRLARLAAARQTLVVTHAPQVAARADHHYIVRKEGAADVTTTILPLTEADPRREEIARMLSGASITPESRAAAEKLLESSANVNRSENGVAKAI
ncbi:MAG: DNA repair protein RecN [Alphaproteobacteria bacterium]|nr:DNA repair protein RecN [Alphaproteobacteria bacterium]